MKLLLATSAIIVAGCASPLAYTTAPLVQLDRDTSYSVEDRPTGFSLTILYDRYQFIPESTAVAAACKSAITALAHTLAERKGRQIAPLDEQRIQLSMGRNGFTGITSCSATAVAVWR